MPDAEADLIFEMYACFAGLKKLGWEEAMYCPKDGTVFEVIEAGSTGIHDCIYEGKWAKGSWWILEGGDMYPSRPILWRAKQKAGAKRDE